MRALFVVALWAVVWGWAGLVRADALAPGERPVQYSYRVRSGLGADWQLVMYPHGTSGGAPDEPTLIRVQGEGPYYCGRWHQPRFYAMRTTDAAALDGLSGTALQTFLDTDARVARGPNDVRVSPVRTLPESSDVREIEDTYTVSAVSGNTLTISSQRRTTPPEDDVEEVGRPPSSTRPAVPAATVDGDEDDCSVSSTRPARVGLLLALLVAGAWIVVRARRSR